MKRFLFFSNFLIFFCFCSYAQQPSVYSNNAQLQREYLVNTLLKIADPVLQNLANNQLKKNMPVNGKRNDRHNYTYLEAFGRLLSGMAPWMELGAGNTPEGKLRTKYIQMARAALKNATDSLSPDFMNFNKGGQPLVDAAFLAQALLRAPTQLWEPLDSLTKKNIIRALRSSRVITPSQSNWLLFTAMVEAALLKFDGDYDRTRIEYALNMHQLWYKGDGVYGDGANFHWDYYNSFVIQPMLLEVTATLKEKKVSAKTDQLYALFLKSAKRYAAILERLISPEGTYPPIGRSLAYRFGAFQHLSKMALMHMLPQELKPQQVRAALFTVIKKQVEAEGTFDKNGWLKVGFYGYQPGLGENYISTGSLYLCAQAFLFLGLPPDDPLWKGNDLDWTAKKIWTGTDAEADHAID